MCYGMAWKGGENERLKGQKKERKKGDRGSILLITPRVGCNFWKNPGIARDSKNSGGGGGGLSVQKGAIHSETKGEREINKRGRRGRIEGL